MDSEPVVYDFADPSLWVPVYLPLVQVDKRRKILYGSRDSAKSSHISRSIIVRMLEEKFKGILIRKTYDSIRESQYDEIKQVVEEWGLEDVFVFNTSPIQITCTETGAKLIGKGLDKPGKAKSMKGVSLAWYEEADELRLQDFTQTTLSLRGKNIEEWISFNSPGPDHWILQRFFPMNSDGTPDLSFETGDGMFTWVPSPDSTVAIMHTCYKHNPYCNAERRAQHEWLANHLPEEYRTSGLGLIGRKNIGSLWLKQFTRAKHTRVMLHNTQDADLGGYIPSLPVHLAFDQNNLPYATCLVIQVVPIPGDRIKEVRILKELCMKPPKNTTEHACDEFIYHYGHTRPQVYIYGDPTGGNRAPRKTKNEALTHYDAITTTLRAFLGPGYNRVSKFPPSIKGRQKFMERVLADGTEIRLVIDQSCKNTIGDFEHLVEDENGGFIKKRVEDKETGQSWEERGHAMDALVNFMSQCFPDLYKYISRA